MEDLKALLEKIVETPDKINVSMVFGEPRTLEGYTLIPVAEVSYGYGFGAGGGPQSCDCDCECDCTDEACECEHPAEHGACACEEAAGEAFGGGGAGVKARPLAFIEVSAAGVNVKPIQDEQRIALAGIALSAWVIGWVGLVLRELFKKH